MSLAWVSRTYAAPTSDSNASLSATAVAHAAGNALFVIIHGNTASFGAAMSDTAGNTYTNVSSGTDGTGFYALYRAHNITGHAANVIAATLNVAQTFGAMVVQEVSGMGTDTPVATVGYGSGISDGGANAVFADLSFTGSDAFYMGLSIVAFENSTSGLHPGATATVFGTDGPNTFPFFKDVRHVVGGSPHQCGVNLNIGVSEAYRYASVVYTAGTPAPPSGTALLGQGIM